MSDEIEILRHRVAVLERNLDLAREDHDRERRIMLDRCRVAYETIEALRPLALCRKHPVDAYDRAADALNAWARAPYVPESWYRPQTEHPEGSYVGGWDAAEHERTVKARIAESEARCAVEAARNAAQVGKRRR